MHLSVFWRSLWRCLGAAVWPAVFSGEHPGSCMQDGSCDLLFVCFSLIAGKSWSCLISGEFLESRSGSCSAQSDGVLIVTEALISLNCKAACLHLRQAVIRDGPLWLPVSCTFDHIVVRNLCLFFSPLFAVNLLHIRKLLSSSGEIIPSPPREDFTVKYAKKVLFH